MPTDKTAHTFYLEDDVKLVLPKVIKELRLTGNNFIQLAIYVLATQGIIDPRHLKFLKTSGETKQINTITSNGKPHTLVDAMQLNTEMSTKVLDALQQLSQEQIELAALTLSQSDD